MANELLKTIYEIDGQDLISVDCPFCGEMSVRVRYCSFCIYCMDEECEEAGECLQFC